MKEAIRILKSEHQSISAVRDPVAIMQKHDFEQLFARIVRLAPDPVGLGERWKAA